METTYLDVDNLKNLWICDNSTGNDIEWVDKFKEEIRKFHPDNNALFYSIEILKFERLKSNNYKIEANISGTYNPADIKYCILLNNSGEILKKKILRI